MLRKVNIIKHHDLTHSKHVNSQTTYISSFGITAQQIHPYILIIIINLGAHGVRVAKGAKF